MTKSHNDSEPPEQDARMEDFTDGGWFDDKSIPPPKYRVVRVADLPQSNPFRATKCMAVDAAAAPPGSVCCWYHGGDWHRPAQDAIDLVAAAENEAIAGTAIATDVLRRARALNLDDWEQSALMSLVCVSQALGVDSAGDWINGQHRGFVLKQQGVPQVLVVD